MDRINLRPLLDVSARRRMPALIAHRGARREAPENTIPAFEKAIERGADGIEFDVLLTSDKMPVVTHNDDLSVLTHYRGYAHATPFSTVKALDVGSHFSVGTAGTTMPTLPEVLDVVKDHNVLTIVEIKAQPGMTSSAAMLVGGIIRDFKLRGSVIVSSSSMKIIRELLRHHPDIPRAFVLKKKVFSFFRTTFFARMGRLSAIHPSLRAVSPEMVERLHRRGMRVDIWTANEPDELDLCMALETDGIITDDILFAKRYLKLSSRGGVQANAAIPV